MIPIPSPSKFPLLGNLLHLDLRKPLQSTIDIGRKYYPIMRLYYPSGESIVIITSVELAKQVMNEEVFEKDINNVLQMLRNTLIGDGLFTAYTNENNWEKAHRILLPAFSQNAMKMFHSKMLDASSRLLAKWHNIPSEQYFCITDDMTKLTFETIGLCGFDYRFNSFGLEKNHPFVQGLLNTFTEVMKTAFLPKTMIRLRFLKQKRMKRDVLMMNGNVDKIIQDRKANPELYKDSNDLLNLMLTANDPITGEQLDDINIRYQILTFLIAGHETTSGLLSFALYFLLTHHDILKKAYQEVDYELGTDINKTPTYEEINKLKYIKQILFESLRLYPTAPAFGVKPKHDVVLDGKYEILKTQSVIVLLPLLHRDPNVWGDDAEEFNPDRFSEEEVNKRDSDGYKPFGNGQRACIGRVFAIQEATLLMGLILQRYKFSLRNTTLEIQESLSIKPKNLYAKITPRKESEKFEFRHEKTQHNARKIEETKIDLQVSKIPLHILFGSNLGTAKEIALRLTKIAERQGFHVTLLTLDESIEIFPTIINAIIITSTYNGYPPDNAVKFKEWLQGYTQLLPNVHYTVFGCGNSQWKNTFQAFPNFIDKRLQELKAVKFYERGVGDANDDFDNDFEKWNTDIWKYFVSDISHQGEIVQKNTKQSISFSTPSHTFHTMRMKKNEDIIHHPSRSTRHIEFEFLSKQEYEAGDYLVILPKNPMELVEKIRQRFDVNITNLIAIEDPITKKITMISTNDFLQNLVEFREIASKHQIRSLAEKTICPPEKKELQKLHTELYQTEIVAKKITFVDLLCRYISCEINFNDAMELFSPLKPRYYSISSKATEQTCSITVGISVGQDAHQKFVYGVCSNYLKNLHTNDVVFAEVRKSNFHLPSDISKPIIMIATGTGLAPFMSFLYTREEQSKYETLGKMTLFYGCKDPSIDFIYRDELQKMNFCNIFPAYSQVENKQRVQSIIKEHISVVDEILDQKGYIYICGNMSMANEVLDIIEERLRSKSMFENMFANGHILVDAWTS